MFDETPVAFYDENKTKILETYADIRNFDKQVTIDSVVIDISRRLFCKSNSSIDKKQYVTFDNQTYKIIKIHPHIGYLELWLYECEVIAI